MNKAAIIENSRGLGHYFTRYLNTEEYQIFPVWNTSKFPKEEFDAYIFTGDYNNISDGLLPLHKKEIEFVKSIKNKKIFASCFFHQLFGKIYGGGVRKREQRFFGWNKIMIKQKHPIFNGLSECYFLNLNVDEINEKPKNAKVLATNQDCIYQILQYGEKILTCQSHPEIFKQDALELINIHRKVLLNGCPNLDEILNHTKMYADDKSNKLFLSNITKWLLL